MLWMGYNISIAMQYLENLCGCLSPLVRQNIVDYLNSSQLNSQVLEEEKVNEGDEAPKGSIYDQIKTKSYYFMKLKEKPNGNSLVEEGEAEGEQGEGEGLQPNYYPHNVAVTPTFYQALYSKKLQAFRYLVSKQISEDYAKVYDSQDNNRVQIYAKQEINMNRRFNSYRFTFRLQAVKQNGQEISPKSYLELQAKSGRIGLLKDRKELEETKQGLTIVRRCFDKVLVVAQHEFYLAEKGEMRKEGEEGEEKGEEGEEKGQVAYSICFSVKPPQPATMSEYSLGWANLVGMRVQSIVQQQKGNSLHEMPLLVFDGYINVQLDIGVNANMLKQPIAKEIRAYISKLSCELTGSDAI